jgi:hypothetical protein
VRRITHRKNCHPRWPEFRAYDSEANDLPRLEREREQEHVDKAENARRCVGHGSATLGDMAKSRLTEPQYPAAEPHVHW